LELYLICIMTNLQWPALLFLFLCGHALADFALQTEWIATNKNRHVRRALSPELRAQMQIIWPHLLTAHSLHHGLMVYLVSQKLSLGLAETAIHWLTDFGKCEKWYGFHADQILHVAAKVLWTALIVTGVAETWI
jgi:hypothetical protein